jgi:hypothetical protein
VKLAGYFSSLGAADPKVSVSFGISVELDRKVRRIRKGLPTQA